MSFVALGFAAMLLLSYILFLLFYFVRVAVLLLQSYYSNLPWRKLFSLRNCSNPHNKVQNSSKSSNLAYTILTLTNITNIWLSPCTLLAV